MNIVYCKIYLSEILSKLTHFLLLKRNFPYDPVTKPSNVSICFVKNFVKSHISHETRASSTVSCGTHRGDKIILYIFDLAMQTKLISCMILSTHEKSSPASTLRYYCISCAGNQELVKLIVGTKFKYARFVYIIKRKIGCDS